MKEYAIALPSCRCLPELMEVDEGASITISLCLLSLLIEAVSSPE